MQVYLNQKWFGGILVGAKMETCIGDKTYPEAGSEEGLRFASPAGLLGMNVGGIPWNTDLQGFLYMGVISARCSTAVIVLLRLKKWG